MVEPRFSPQQMMQYLQLALHLTEGKPLVIGKVHPSFQTLRAHWYPPASRSKNNLIISTPPPPGSCSFCLVSSRRRRRSLQLLWISSSTEWGQLWDGLEIVTLCVIRSLHWENIFVSASFLPLVFSREQCLWPSKSQSTEIMGHSKSTESKEGRVCS